MGDIVNLRMARKRKAFADKQIVADANRAKFGRTRAERDAQDSARRDAEKRLDGHKLDNENTE